MGGEATTKKGHCKTSGAVGSKREQSVGKDCVDGRVVAVASFNRTRAICGLGPLAFEGHEKMVWSTVPRYFNFISDRMDGYKLLFSFSGGRLSAGTCTFPALASIRALQVDITAVVRAHHFHHFHHFHHHFHHFSRARAEEKNKRPPTTSATRPGKELPQPHSGDVAAGWEPCSRLATTIRFDTFQRFASDIQIAS